MEQQRAAIQGFSASARMTSGAVSDVAGRMANIADLVDRSTASAAEIAEVATEMQRTSESLRLGIPEIVRNATRADMRECTRYDVDMTAQFEVDGRSFRARVHDISESGIRIDKRPEFARGRPDRGDVRRPSPGQRPHCACPRRDCGRLLRAAAAQGRGSASPGHRDGGCVRSVRIAVSGSERVDLAVAICSGGAGAG